MQKKPNFKENDEISVKVAQQTQLNQKSQAEWTNFRQKMAKFQGKLAKFQEKFLSHIAKFEAKTVKFDPKQPISQPKKGHAQEIVS